MKTHLGIFCQGNVNCYKGHDDASNIYGNTIIFVRYAYL